MKNEEEIKISEQPVPMCPSCGNNPAEGPMGCPFHMDVNNKDEKDCECFCCSACRHACAMDI